MNVWSYDECKNSSKYEITRSMLCANGIGVSRQSACLAVGLGDPLMRMRDDGSYVLIGIASWGEGDGCDKPFGGNIVYTNITAVIEWLDATIIQHPCEESSLDCTTDKQLV